MGGKGIYHASEHVGVGARPGPGMDRRLGDRQPLPHILGWFGAGLGTGMVLAPDWVRQTVGIGYAPGRRAAVAATGLRELMTAAGLLTRPRSAWLWGRVAGDVMDLWLLSRVLAGQQRTGRGRTGAATAAVTGILAVDLYAAVTRSRGPVLEAAAATTISRPRQEVYRQWRRLDSLPGFMAHLDAVQITGPSTSRWRASAPFGATVEWDAVITDDVPGELIAWRSERRAVVASQGEVRFAPAPGGQGTEVHARLRYTMPAGKLGESAARYFGEDPHQQLDDDLRRFKQVAETGEVVRSEGAPGGKRARREFPQHPARPLTPAELADLDREEQR